MKRLKKRWRLAPHEHIEIYTSDKLSASRERKRHLHALHQES